MPVQLEGRRVFIASPNGLDTARGEVRKAITRRNKASSIADGVIFIDEGWEDIPPGAGRSQSLVNDLLDQCDYLIVLLADRWGSSPGGGEYSSGTEEEFFRSLDNLADEAKFMRDIHVYFRTVPDPQLADPGVELLKVLAFKNRLQNSKQIHYGTFDSLETLSVKIDGSLQKWSQDRGPRSPITIELPLPDSPSVEAGSDPLSAAIEAAKASRLVQAEILFAKAIQSGDARAAVKAARFYRRQGLFDKAIALNQSAVESLATKAVSNSDKPALLVNALANIGVIHRKKGDLERSIRVLREAIDTGRSSSPIPHEEVAYAFDNLGHSLGQIGKHDEASEALELAASERAEIGSAEFDLQSSLNRGWQVMRSGDTATALEVFLSIESAARESEAALRANCLTGIGDALLRLGRHAEAIDYLFEASEINIEASIAEGISISNSLLARAYISTGELDKAVAANQRALRESNLSGSAIGLTNGFWVTALIECARGDAVEARRNFAEASRLAQLAGNISLNRAIKRDEESHLSRLLTESNPDSANTNT